MIVILWSNSEKCGYILGCITDYRAIAEYSPHSLGLQRTALTQIKTQTLTLMSVNKTLTQVSSCRLVWAVFRSCDKTTPCTFSVLYKLLSYTTDGKEGLYLRNLTELKFWKVLVMCLLILLDISNIFLKVKILTSGSRPYVLKICLTLIQR